jgi:hypothetical protein
MSVKDIEDKIAKEHSAIAKSQATNAELTHQRAVALEAGNDGEVDRIEVDMKINDTAVTRGRDRIVILERRLEETKQQERESALDSLAAETDRARIEGESIIAEYAKHAAAIAPVLAKLKAIDERIVQANRELKAAGRNTINTPNAIRCRPHSHGTRTVRRTVGIGEPEHPMHKVAQFDANGICRHRETQQPLEQFGEFDVVQKTFDAGHSPDPLYSSVVLPGAEVGASSYWPNPNASAELVTQQPTILSKVRSLIGNKAA